MKTLVVALILWPTLALGQVIIPPPVPEPRDSVWLKAALAASLVAHATDLSTSSWAFGQGGFKETNPVMRPFTEGPVTFGLAKSALALGANYALYRHRKRHPTLVLWIAVAQAAGVAYVAHHNAAQIQR